MDVKLNYLSHFTFETVQSVSIWISRIIIHLLAKNPREFIVHGIGRSRNNCARICLHKSIMNIFKKRKWKPSCNDLKDKIYSSPNNIGIEKEREIEEIEAYFRMLLQPYKER